MVRAMRFLKRNEGGALVEFALAVPVLLLLLLGVIDIARGVSMNATMNHAVREGARFAAIHGTDSLDPRTSSEVSAFVRDRLTWLDTSSLTVEVDYQPNAGSGSRVVVRARKQFDYMLSTLADLAPYELGAQSVMTVH